MSNETFRVVSDRPSHVHAIMADNNRTALRIEAEGLLAQQPALEAQRRGFTADQSTVIKQAVASGALKLNGLRQISVEDQAGRRSIHWVGDDHGNTWQEFMHPGLKVGRFATPDKSAATKQWWQK